MRLALGTVQFGLDYGVSNRDGRTPPDEVSRILAYAEQAGIRVLDTASSYGTSEEVLGCSLSPSHTFRIVTKTPHFRREQLDKKDAENLVSTFQDSLRKLGQERVYGLMVHHAADLLRPGAEHLFSAMAQLKADGLVTRIGASIYEPEQIDRLLANYDLDLVQAPVNVLDQRLVTGGQLQRLQSRGVEVHARSIFLQGLLLMPLNEIPTYFRPILPKLASFQMAMRELGCSQEAGSLAFARQLGTIDYMVTGQANLKQLEANVDAYNTPFPDSFDFSGFACDDPVFVNPSLWTVA